MIKITPPNLTHAEIFNSCMQGIGDLNLRAAYNSELAAIDVECDRYHLLAQNEQLYLYPPNHSTNEQIAIGRTTKLQLKKLYTQYFSAANKPARKYYNQIRLSAPQNICPYCGIGEVRTLDHYLPKDLFPVFSIYHNNLIPACRDCQSEKLSEYAKDHVSQALHPYYDQPLYFTSKWLYAEVNETTWPAVQFNAIPPGELAEPAKRRIESHFIDYRLAERYAVQAGPALSELFCILPILQGTPQLLRDHLETTAQGLRNAHINSWRGALYEALARSDWYCEEGYCRSPI